MKDGSTGWIPKRADPNILWPLGPTDPDVPFVFAKDSAGNYLGGLTTFAMHTAIYGGPPFSACYPGHLQSALRSKLQSPQFVSLFCQGCAGNVNHIDSMQPETISRDEHPRYAGQILATALANHVKLAREVTPGWLSMQMLSIKSALRTHTPAELAQAKQVMITLDRNQASFLEKVSAWRTMYEHDYRQTFGDFLPNELQAIRFDNDTAMVFLPHEVFVEIGLWIKAASPFRTTIVVSLANDTDFYIPTRKAFEEGHYEPTTCPLKPGVGEQFAQSALELLLTLKATERDGRSTVSINSSNQQDSN
jgi:hypothetical protein